MRQAEPFGCGRCGSPFAGLPAHRGGQKQQFSQVHQPEARLADVFATNRSSSGSFLASLINADRLHSRTGISANSVAELQVPNLQSQLPDADSRTSLPVITIKKTSDVQAVPTTTTIVLQHSPLNSALPQPSPSTVSVSHLSSLPSTNDHSSHRLSVLKSKNGRTNMPPAVIIKDSKPDTQSNVSLSLPAKSSHHSKRPKSAQQHRPPSPQEDPPQHPARARSPPAAHTTSSFGATVSDDAAGNDSGQTRHARCHQPKPSPFEAPEAQLQEARGSNSDKSNSSNSNSDKSAENAGQLYSVVMSLGVLHCCTCD